MEVFLGRVWLYVLVEIKIAAGGAKAEVRQFLYVGFRLTTRRYAAMLNNKLK